MRSSTCSVVCLLFLTDDNVAHQKKSQKLLGERTEACLNTMFYALCNLFHPVLEPTKRFWYAFSNLNARFFSFLRFK